MLTATNLSKSYASRKVLDNVSIQLVPGQVCGLLGRNGAGKTTLFKILCGLIKPDSGNVKIQSSCAKPIGAIIEKPGLYPYLNAFDNIKIFAGIQGTETDKHSITQSLVKVGLPLDRKDPIRNFSMGMKQRLGVAIALLNNPEYLILDEPFSGLDPTGVASLINLITALAAEQHIAILMSSHLMGELSKCCHYLYVLDNGKMANSGTTSQLINNNVHNFSITAKNISSSVVLRNYNARVGINDARVICNADQISVLLKDLLDEGIDVTSCSPELSLEQLLNQSIVS